MFWSFSLFLFSEAIFFSISEIFSAAFFAASSTLNDFCASNCLAAFSIISFEMPFLFNAVSNADMKLLIFLASAFLYNLKLS